MGAGEGRFCGDQAAGKANAVDVDAFRRNGWLLIKRVFSADEIRGVRETAQRVIRERTDEALHHGSTAMSVADLLAIEELRHVLLDQRILDVYRQLVGADPCYYGNSTARSGHVYTGLQGEWHRDNADRFDLGGPDWRGDTFPLMSLALYLQDHRKHSGGVGVISGSNRPTHPSIWRQRLSRWAPFGWWSGWRATFVPSEPGDLVVWDLRTFHLGEVSRYRPFRSLVFRPRVGSVLAKLGLRAPEDGLRTVIFIEFGAPGDHLDHDLEFLMSTDWMPQLWSQSDLSAEAIKAASDEGLSVVPVRGHYELPEALAEP